MQPFLRIGSAAIGLCAAAIALLVPVFVFIEQARDNSKYPGYLRFWPLVGTWFFVLVISAFFVSLSYMCFRFTVVEQRRIGTAHHGADRVFRSIGFASTFAIITAVFSQLLILLVAAIRLRHWPKVVRDAIHIGWSPSDWAAMRDSPYFLLIVSLLSASVFYWEYRKSSRASSG